MCSASSAYPYSLLTVPDTPTSKTVIAVVQMTCICIAIGGTGRRNTESSAAGVGKRAKLPAKNPMVLQKQNGSYYRVRVLEEKAQQVKIGESHLCC